MGSRRTWYLACAVSALVLGTAACSASPAAQSGTASGPASSAQSSSAAATSAAQISASIARGAKGVKVNRSLRLDVSHGTLTKVSVNARRGRRRGSDGLRQAQLAERDPVAAG